MRLRASFCFLIAVICSGCTHQDQPKSPAAASTGFRDAAKEAGINFTMNFLPKEQGTPYKVNLYDHGCGVAVGDIDADGHDDIYLVNQNGPNVLYHNRGDGTFEDITSTAGVGLGDRICVGAVFADYDNDGKQDLFVTSIRGGNVLFHNEGNNHFKDVTASAGVVYNGHSQMGVFFDYDRDGLLDLFVTNTGKWTSDEFNKDGHYYTGVTTLAEVINSEPEHNILYHNIGHGKFVDVTASAHLEGVGFAADAVAFDYDEDGWPDLFVTDMLGKSQLYRNTGKGVFVDLTSRTLVKTSWGGMGAKVLDYDNDGHLDLFLADMHSDMWVQLDKPDAVEDQKKYPTAKGRIGGPPSSGGITSSGQAPPSSGVPSPSSGKPPARPGSHSSDSPEGVVFGNTLFHSEGKGRFTETSDAAGVETFWPWGAATGDFDGDGYVDMFIPTGMSYPYFYWHNYLLMNTGKGVFIDRSKQFGIDPPPGGINKPQTINGKPDVRSSRSVVAADFNDDGMLDLIVNNFNDRAYYYVNQFPKQNYIKFSLTGTKSNRDAIGAIVRVFAGNRQFMRAVEGASGYLSCPSKIVHFGLGNLQTVDRVVIEWPSGKKQEVPKPGINTINRITEPK